MPAPISPAATSVAAGPFPHHRATARLRDAPGRSITAPRRSTANRFRTLDTVTPDTSTSRASRAGTASSSAYANTGLARGATRGDDPRDQLPNRFRSPSLRTNSCASSIMLDRQKSCQLTTPTCESTHSLGEPLTPESWGWFPWWQLPRGRFATAPRRSKCCERTSTNDTRSVRPADARCHRVPAPRKPIAPPTVAGQDKFTQMWSRQDVGYAG